MRRLINRIQELTGIYGLGFRSESAAGLMLPVLFVIVVGGLGALLAWRF